MLLSFSQQHPNAEHLTYSFREEPWFDEIVVFLDQDLGQSFGAGDQEPFLIEKSGIVE